MAPPADVRRGPPEDQVPLIRAAARPLAAAVLLRGALFVLLLVRPETAIEPDSPGYLSLSEHWSASYLFGTTLRDLAAFRLPLYPLFLAALGGWAIPAQFALSFAPILALAPFAARAPRGRAVLWCLACDPLWAIFPSLYLTEVLFGVLLFLSLRSGGAASGLAAAAAALTKSVGILMLPFLFLAARSRRAFLLGLLPLGLFVALRSGYSTQFRLAATREGTKTRMQEGSLSDLAGVSFVRVAAASGAKIALGGSSDSTLRRIGAPHDHALRSILDAWAILASGTLWVLAARGARAHPPRTRWILLGLLAAILLPPIWILGYGRFRLPAVPILALLALPPDPDLFCSR